MFSCRGLKPKAFENEAFNTQLAKCQSMSCPETAAIKAAELTSLLAPHKPSWKLKGTKTEKLVEDAHRES